MKPFTLETVILYQLYVNPEEKKKKKAIFAN